MNTYNNDQEDDIAAGGFAGRDTAIMGECKGGIIVPISPDDLHRARIQRNQPTFGGISGIGGGSGSGKKRNLQDGGRLLKRNLQDGAAEKCDGVDQNPRKRDRCNNYLEKENIVKLLFTGNCTSEEADEIMTKYAVYVTAANSGSPSGVEALASASGACFEVWWSKKTSVLRNPGGSGLRGNHLLQAQHEMIATALEEAFNVLKYFFRGV